MMAAYMGGVGTGALGAFLGMCALLVALERWQR